MTWTEYCYTKTSDLPIRWMVAKSCTSWYMWFVIIPWFIGLTWFNHPRWCRISQPSIVSWIFLYFDVVLSQEVFIATSSLQFTSPVQHAIETGFDLALEKAQGWERMAQFIFITCHSYVIYPLQLTLHNHSSILSVLLSWNNDFEVQMIIIQYSNFMQFYCIPWYSPYFQPNLPVFLFGFFARRQSLGADDWYCPVICNNDTAKTCGSGDFAECVPLTESRRWNSIGNHGRNRRTIPLLYFGLCMFI